MQTRKGPDFGGLHKNGNCEFPLNFLYCLWINLPKNYIILLSVTMVSKIYSFQIDRGKAAHVPHGL